MNYSIFTPTTLATMAAELSQYLADQYDGENCISAQEWDAQWQILNDMVGALTANVGDEFVQMLQDAGADPAIILKERQHDRNQTEV